jgi:hypothetical protein
MSDPIFVHATGLAALSLSVASALQRCDRSLHRGHFLAGIFWTLNSLLLGATTAAALSCVSAARVGTAGLVRGGGDRIRVVVCALFAAVSLVTAAMTWQGWPTLMPAAASVLATYAAFYLTGRQLRLALLASALLWMQCVLSIHSPEQIIGNVLAAAAAAAGVWRTRLQPAAVQGQRVTSVGAAAGSA